MILYHFTAAEYLPAIRAEGLSKGEVPLTPTEYMNAVWLTTDRDPSGHGLCDERELSTKEKAFLGVPLDHPAKFPNKRAIRLTVKVKSADRRLVAWRPWAHKRLHPDWLATLERTGGNKGRGWFLYWGVLPPSTIVSIEDLRAAEDAAAHGVATD